MNPDDTDGPEITEYEVTTSKGCSYLQTYAKAISFAKKEALRLNCNTEVMALFDDGRNAYVAEFSGDDGDLVEEYCTPLEEIEPQND